MKKALALLGTLILIVSIVPMGAFASDYTFDPGIANYVINSVFGWYTDTPYIDSYGWIYNTYFTSINSVSYGIYSSNVTIGTAVTLAQPGDYVEYSFGSDILSFSSTPLWVVKLAYDSSTSSTHYEIPEGSIKCYLSENAAFYEFNSVQTIDSRKWTYHTFIVNRPSLENTVIRIEYNGTPCIFPVAMIQFEGYRGSTTGNLTQEQMITLQSNIVNCLNIARLADIIGEINPEQVDLTTIETTTASILSALSDVPNILNKLTTIDTSNTQILSGINTLVSYFDNLFNDKTWTALNPDMYKHDGTVISTNSSYKTVYYVIPFNTTFRDKFLKFRFSYNTSNPTSSLQIRYYFISNINDLIRDKNIMHNVAYETFNLRGNFVECDFDILPHSYNYNMAYLVISITSDESNIYAYPSYASLVEYYAYKAIDYKYSIFDRILYYLKNLSLGSSEAVPSDIQTTTQQIQQQAQTVDTFHQTAELDLNTGLQNVPVNDYQITATTGTQYMKQYTENLFTASNGFRIWFMYPLILATLALLIRWRYSR